MYDIEITKSFRLLVMGTRPVVFNKTVLNGIGKTISTTIHIQHSPRFDKRNKTVQKVENIDPWKILCFIINRCYFVTFVVCYILDLC